MNKLLLVLLINVNILFGASSSANTAHLVTKYLTYLHPYKIPVFETGMKEHQSESYRKYIKRNKEEIKRKFGIGLPNEQLLKLLNQRCCTYEQWSKNNNDLLNASFGEHWSVIKIVEDLLHSKQVDVNAKRHNNTALMLAARVGKFPELVELLLNNGATINTEIFSNGWPELVWAIYGCNQKIVELLIKHGANVNTYVKNGFHNGTILMYACGRANKEIVELLIKAGADIYAKDEEGKTALEYSLNPLINKKMKDLLKSHSSSRSRCCCNI